LVWHSIRLDMAFDTVLLKRFDVERHTKQFYFRF